MKGIRALSSATKLTVLGLTANAVGIWIQACAATIRSAARDRQK
jgi:hypothetical protein